MNANELLQAVKKKYGSLESYSDNGIVEFSRAQSRNSIHFTTHFLRPDKYHFVWREVIGADTEPSVFAVWSDGVTGRSCIDGDLHFAEGESFLAGATAPSCGANLMIVKLLMPNLIDVAHFWTEMSNPVLVDEQVVDGEHCFHIVGDGDTEKDTEVWIGCDSMLVRRIVERMEITLAEVERARAQALELFASMGMKENSPAVQEALAALPARAQSHSFTFRYQKVKLDGSVDDRIFSSQSVE